jgi:transposase
MLFVIPLSGRSVTTIGWRWHFALAFATMTVGCTVFVAALTSSGLPKPWLVVGAMTLCGIAAALAHPQLSGAIVASAPAEQAGMASAVTVAIRQAGFAVGVAALSVLASSERTPYPLLCRCYGASGEDMAPWALFNDNRWSSPMSQHFRFDASRSLTALEQDSTIIAVIEMSQTKWLVATLVPGVERQPLKKFDANEETLLKLLHRWRHEAGQAGRNIKRIVVAYEAGRDGFWLALAASARC